MGKLHNRSTLITWRRGLRRQATAAERLLWSALRTAYLIRCGIDVLRFDNADVETNLDGVVAAIARACQRRDPPP